MCLENRLRKKPVILTAGVSWSSTYIVWIAAVLSRELLQVPVTIRPNVAGTHPFFAFHEADSGPRELDPDVLNSDAVTISTVSFLQIKTWAAPTNTSKHCRRWKNSYRMRHVKARILVLQCLTTAGHVSMQCLTFGDRKMHLMQTAASLSMEALGSHWKAGMKFISAATLDTYPQLVSWRGLAILPRHIEHFHECSHSENTAIAYESMGVQLNGMRAPAISFISIMNMWIC